MEADPVRWRAEELLAQADWLGALARRLVADPSGADDVVQETWISALRHPPERERALRPWLAKVARNVARMQRRGEASRQRRESAVASQREVATPDELVARLEGQRMLIDALARLAEPYRATVLLAYFEHLGSEEIARRQGVAAGTVRWRLKVGLDALRDDLDRRQAGDRRAWVLALAPLVRSDNQLALATSTALSWQGVLVMQTLLKVGAAAAAVVVLVGVLAWSGVLPFIANERSDEPLPVTFRALVAAAPASELAVLDEIAVERAAVSVDAPREAESVASEAPPRIAVVTARFVDRAGHAIAGVVVRAKTNRRAESNDPAARSDADGRVRWEYALLADEPGADFEIEASAPGFATRVVEARVNAGATSSLGELVLEPGGDIAGRVVDPDGAPLAGVGIALCDIALPQAELELLLPHSEHFLASARTETDVDGRFVFGGAPTGFVRLAACRAGLRVAFSRPIEVREAQVSEGVELVMEPLESVRSIEGIVLTPDGRPSGGARVRYQSRTSSGSRTADEGGRFRIVLSREGEYDLRATDAQRQFGGATVDGVEMGARDVVLRLSEPLEIELVVRAPDGTPVEDFSARAFEPDTPPHGITYEPDATHAAGRAKLRPTTPRFVITVEAPGFELARVGPFEGALGKPLEIALQPIAVVRGSVLAGGAPQASGQISAFARGEGHHEKNGFRVAFDPERKASAQTDPNGAFELTLRAKGDFQLRVEVKGFAAAEIALDNYDPRAGRDVGAILLTQGGAIEGRVVARAGRDVTGTVVAFSRGDGCAFSQRVSADGEFRAERLMPGRWEVKRVDEEVPVDRSSSRSWLRGAWEEIPWNCEVFEGRTTRFDLALDDGVRDGVRLAGRLSVDGAAPGAWTALLLSGPMSNKTHEGQQTKLDGEGRFELRADATGEARVVLTALSGELEGLRVIAPMTLAPGDNAWSLDLRTALVELVDVQIDPDSPDPLTVVSIDARWSLAMRAVATSGTSKLRVPAGRLKLWRYDERTINLDPLSWPALAEATVAPGETAALRMP